ncbi:hypothetical protein QBC44DRAFT_47689 [Cladorrhinum sp. PSN332]|nr:hypothetical protein QBC44DRAFT_47689 [Cladorrhinum sp. PSN332]
MNHTQVARSARGDWDKTIGDINLARFCSLMDAGYTFQPTQFLGKLEVFPLEILQEILMRSDILSIYAFGLANKSAHGVVASLPTLKLAKRYFPDVIRAIMGTRAQHFDLLTLHQALCSNQPCVTCRSYGGYFHLLRCARVCSHCFTRYTIFSPIGLPEAMETTDLSRERLGKIPHISSIPGNYSWLLFSQLFQDRQPLWDRTMLNSLSQSKTTSLIGLEKSSFKDRGSEPGRFMSVLPVPWLDPVSGKTDWGVYCIACEATSHYMSRKLYTPKGLRDHVSSYGPIIIRSNRPRHSSGQSTQSNLDIFS